MSMANSTLIIQTHCGYSRGTPYRFLCTRRFSVMFRGLPITYGCPFLTILALRGYSSSLRHCKLSSSSQPSQRDLRSPESASSLISPMSFSPPYCCLDTLAVNIWAHHRFALLSLRAHTPHCHLAHQHSSLSFLYPNVTTSTLLYKHWLWVHRFALHPITIPPPLLLSHYITSPCSDITAIILRYIIITFIIHLACTFHSINTKHWPLTFSRPAIPSCFVNTFHHSKPPRTTALL